MDPAPGSGNQAGHPGSSCAEICPRSLSQQVGSWDSSAIYFQARHLTTLSCLPEGLSSLGLERTVKVVTLGAACGVGLLSRSGRRAELPGEMAGFSALPPERAGEPLLWAFGLGSEGAWVGDWCPWGSQGSGPTFQ